MPPWLRSGLSILTIWAALLAAALLAFVGAGMLPAREPAAPDVERFSVDKAVSRVAALPRVEPRSDPAVKPRFEVGWVPLCAAPAAGARLDRVRAFAGTDGFLVWCKDGYALFTLNIEQGGLHATRMARFKARGELPGGAAAGDLDGDGQLDLVLGVAPRPGVVHRAGAGVFWLRGRVQGGYEPARALVEMPSAALAAHRAPGASRDTLFVLTTGDVAAQRPGELWVFGAQPALVREKVFPAALDPRGLLLRPSGDANLLELWIVSGQPGRVQAMMLDLERREPRSERAVQLPLRGAQAFGHDSSLEGAPYVRDTTGVYRVRRGEPPALEAFADKLNAGPFALGDLDANHEPDLFAAIEGGVAWIERAGGAPRELALPSELRALDVEIVRDAGGQPHPLVLVQGKPDPASLSLWLLPRPPWPEVGASVPGAQLRLTPGRDEDAKTLAEVALE